MRRALANTPMRVHQDIILTDQMFIEAVEEVILLPAKTRYEQDDGGTETITERRIVFSQEIPRQVGEAKAEWKILRELAATVYPERAGSIGCETGQDASSVLGGSDAGAGVRGIPPLCRPGGAGFREGGRFQKGWGVAVAITVSSTCRPSNRRSRRATGSRPTSQR